VDIMTGNSSKEAQPKSLVKIKVAKRALATPKIGDEISDQTRPDLFCFEGMNTTWLYGVGRRVFFITSSSSVWEARGYYIRRQFFR